MANRDEIIAKIRALRAKAEDAAATEAEAMSAAEFAARLLTKHELKKQRETVRHTVQGSSNSNALVVVKSEIIKRKMEEMGLTIGKARSQKQYLDPTTLGAGYAHGDKVNLGRPFGGNQSMGELA